MARPERLVNALWLAVKKGKGREGIDAARSLTLAGVMLRSVASDMVWEKLDALFLQLQVRIITSFWQASLALTFTALRLLIFLFVQTHTVVKVRVKIAETISIGFLSSPPSEANIAQAMARFAKCFGGEGEGGEADEEQINGQVVAACVDAWSLLATLISDKILLSRKMLNISVQKLVDLLSHEQVLYPRIVRLFKLCSLLASWSVQKVSLCARLSLFLSNLLTHWDLSKK